MVEIRWRSKIGCAGILPVVQYLLGSFFFFFFFVALRPKSTAMVIVGRSVHLTTLFPGQA